MNESILDETTSKSANLEVTPGVSEILHLGFKYYLNNTRAFIGVQFIALIPILISNFIGIYFFRFHGFQASWETIVISTYFAFFILTFISHAFIGSSYGLAYDIYSSGNEFAEFQGFINYFRRHWWRYILISIILLAATGLSNFIWENFTLWTFSLFNSRDVSLFNSGLPIWNNLLQSILSSIIAVFLDFLCLILFFGIYPSVTAKASILDGVIENFTLLKKRFKPILKISIKIYGLYAIIFLPINWIMFYLEITDIIPNFDYILLSRVLEIVQNSVYYLIILPLLINVQTVIYNSLYPPSGDNNER